MTGVYEQLVHELGSRDNRGVVLLSHDGQVARFSMPEGPSVAVVRHLAGEAEALRERTTKLVGQRTDGDLLLVAAGGDIGAREVLRGASGRTPFGTRVRVLAVDDRGEAWTGPGASPSRELQAALDDVRRRPGKVRLEPDRYETWLDEREAAGLQLLERVRELQESIRGRKPWATLGLAVAIAAVFMLQLLWGGADSTTTAVRMGALVREGHHAAEPWRLLTSSFLHVGWLHLLTDVGVLFLIGAYLEPLIGHWRLLAIWTICAAAGSGMELFVSEGVIIAGSTAGTWGLLGAAATIAFRPNGLLPGFMAAAMRRSLAGTLVVLIVMSVLPNNAAPVHAGGALVGALLTAFGLGTLGMRSFERAAVATGRNPMASVATAAGVLAALLLAGSLALAFVQGQPWLAGSAGPWTSHDLAIPNMTVDLPASLGDPRETAIDTTNRTLDFGDALSSPWTVRVRTSRFVPKALTSLRRFREFRGLKKQLEEERFGGLLRVGTPVEREEAELFVYEEELAALGARGWRHVRLAPTGWVEVLVVADDDVTDLIHERVFASLKTGYEPAEPAQDAEPARDTE